MKKTLIVIACAMVSMNTFADVPKTETDLSGSIIFYSPSGENDIYDNGLGLEAQMNFWLDPSLGIAFSLGIASWPVNEQMKVLFKDYTTVIAGQVKGDMEIIPIGPSVLLRPVNNDQVALTLEAGVRYVIVDSQVEGEVAGADVWGNVGSIQGPVELENGIVGILGITIDGKLGKQASLSIGAGYQFDLSKGEARFMAAPPAENELEAALIKAGLTISF